MQVNIASMTHMLDFRKKETFFVYDTDTNNVEFLGFETFQIVADIEEDNAFDAQQRLKELFEKEPFMNKMFINILFHNVERHK